MVAGVFGVLLINTKTNENTFELSRLQDRQAALDNQQQRLENQIAGYESAGNLDAAARRLGLVKADTPAYIRLPDGKIIGVPAGGRGPAGGHRPGSGASQAAPCTAQKARSRPAGCRSRHGSACGQRAQRAVAGRHGVRFSRRQQPRPAGRRGPRRA